MSRFIPLWLIYLGSGTLMALLTLIWAVRSRQFEDQDRARYIPLADLTAEELAAPAPSRQRAVRYALVVVLACGALAIGGALAIVVRHG